MVGPNFQWHKSAVNLMQTPGFCTVEMAVHYYVQYLDLRNLIVNWKDNDHLAPFLKVYPDGGVHTSEKLASNFLIMQIKYTQNISRNGKADTYILHWQGIVSLPDT